MNARTRLLVVDDDPSVRGLLREYLEGHGFTVAEAASGAQMREQIEHDLPISRRAACSRSAAKRSRSRRWNTTC